MRPHVVAALSAAWRAAAFLIEGIGSPTIAPIEPLPSPEVVRWMNASDVLLPPSLAEGTPTVLVEAQAAGMPIVATNVGGVSEIVHHGRAGLLVRPGQVEPLVAALRELCGHPERWPEFGRYGRAYVERHHDIVTLNRRLVHLFQRLAASPPPDTSDARV